MNKIFLVLTMILMVALIACSSLSPDSVADLLPEAGETAATDPATAAAPAATEEDAHWGYEGGIGPEHWAELDSDYAVCATGTKQSPIDLPGDPAPTLADVTFDYRESAVHIRNNGHTIQVNYDGGSAIEIDGKSYELLQFHFHAPSEHTVTGMNYPLEMHLVHQNQADQSLAVVGVFIEEGSENAAFAPVWSHLPAEEMDEAIATGTTINAAALLPAEQTVYRYSGSLTTPRCSEGVTWSVMNTPIQMSAAQLAAFTSIISGNNRPLQPLKDQGLVVNDAP
jgi:carbonic anhydrase